MTVAAAGNGGHLLLPAEVEARVREARWSRSRRAVDLVDTEELHITYVLRLDIRHI